jgi:type VI secretion system protein ImpH
MSDAAINNMMVDVLHSDLKAEVIAANMIENGVSPDKILIQMLGGGKRTFRKDVEEIEEELSEYDHKEYIHIKTHKEGIYDMLPEGLFHRPTLPKSATTHAEIIKALKRHKDEEKQARVFFLPFESAINDQRIQLALNESLLDIRLSDNKLVEVFSSEWEIFRYLDARQSNIFLFLLPLLHDIRDNYEIAALMFELILQVPVNISLQAQPPIKNKSAFSSALSECRLGVNFTTGNEVFYTGEDEIVVNLGPMENSLLNQYMPRGKKAKIVELLCDYFLPVHVDTSTELLLAGSDKNTRLADGVNDYNCVLGLCTFL